MGLVDGIRRLSRDAAIARFGPGPHFVSMKVHLDVDDDRDDDDDYDRREREVVLELASLDLMPHSVYLFLSQVADGYWSRGDPAFVINAGHVLQACPHPCLEYEDLGGGGKTGYPYADMKRNGMDVVRFQEYSIMYPHARYTIGYAGRPYSGPEFYVNLMDNTLDHGTVEEREFRMGTRVYAAWATDVFGEEGRVDGAGAATIEPYPCFGKVISGFDVVDEIARGVTRARLPTGHDKEEDAGEVRSRLDDNILLRPVRIVSMTILVDYDPNISGDGNDQMEIDKGEGDRIANNEL